jgi:hypothetical protein
VAVCTWAVPMSTGLQAGPTLGDTGPWFPVPTVGGVWGRRARPLARAACTGVGQSSAGAGVRGAVNGEPMPETSLPDCPPPRGARPTPMLMVPGQRRWRRCVQVQKYKMRIEKGSVGPAPRRHDTAPAKGPAQNNSQANIPRDLDLVSSGCRFKPRFPPPPPPPVSTTAGPDAVTVAAAPRH